MKWTVCVLLAAGALLGADDASIQSMIDRASDGDEIQVLPGTYYERIDFKGKSIRVVAWDLESHGPGHPSEHILVPPDDGIEESIVTMAASLVSPDSPPAEMVLEGFTIRDGVARRGGGISASGRIVAEIYRCDISYNRAVGDEPSDLPQGGLGGGVTIDSLATVTILSCAIAYNEAENQGGGIYVAPAPSGQLAEGKISIVNSTITRNRSPANSGAAVFLSPLGQAPCIQNNIIWGNVPEQEVADISSESAVTSRCNLLGVASGVICETCVEGSPAFLFDLDAPDVVPQAPLGRFRLRIGSPGVDQGCDASHCLTRPFGRPLESYLDINGHTAVGIRDCGVDEYFIIFIRADSNIDTQVNHADPIFILQYLFLRGAPVPECDDAADVNDDGKLDIGDGVYGLSYLWAQGPWPFPPFPGRGEDPTQDKLDCEYYPDPPGL